MDGQTLAVAIALSKGSGGGGGSGGGFLKLTINTETDALDKTWKQIHDAALIGPVILVDDMEEQIQIYYLSELNMSENEYYVKLGDMYFSTDSENGYPVISV